MKEKIDESRLYSIELEIEKGKREMQIGNNVYNLPKLEGLKAKNPKPKQIELRQKALPIYIKAYGGKSLNSM